MAAELLTPVDEATDMPLPVRLPAEEILSKNSPETNWHHHFHSSSDPALQTLGGNALRSSRLQLVPAYLHNAGKAENVYHRIFKGPPLPGADDQEKQFELCILAAAGYLPAQAIDMESNDPTIPVNLSSQELNLFRHSPAPSRITDRDVERHSSAMQLPPRQAWRALTVQRKRQADFGYHHFKYSYEPMRAFFKEFILNQDVDISDRAIKRFLSAKDMAKRQALGDTILSKTADQTTLGLRQKYAELHQGGRLHPRMPETPDRLVFRKLGNHFQRASLLPGLETRLVQRVA